MVSRIGERDWLGAWPGLEGARCSGEGWSWWAGPRRCHGVASGAAGRKWRALSGGAAGTGRGGPRRGAGLDRAPPGGTYGLWGFSMSLMAGGGPLLSPLGAEGPELCPVGEEGPSVAPGGVRGGAEGGL